MVKAIKLNSIKDALNLSNYASGLSLDTSVHSKSAIVDARSVMGLYALVGRDDLLFVAPDNANPEEVFKGLKKFGM
jgi:hypothetical protein